MWYRIPINMQINKIACLVKAITLRPGKYYGSSAEEDGPSVATVVRTHLCKMTEVMNASVTSRTMVDVETADKVMQLFIISSVLC